MLLIEELTNSYFVRTQDFLCTLASEVHAVFGGPHGLATHTDIFEVSPTHFTEVFVELRCVKLSSCTAAFPRPCAPHHRVHQCTPSRKPRNKAVQSHVG